MNDRFFLNLIGIPASSMLAITLLANRAVANAPATPLACDLPPTLSLDSAAFSPISQGILVASSATSGDDALANFSVAESDAAVSLFGCDCLSCINALRQLRTQPLLKGGQGHCWSLLEQRVSPQKRQVILQTLEAEEANLGQTKRD
jgi:hypothetical protein